VPKLVTAERGVQAIRDFFREQRENNTSKERLLNRRAASNSGEESFAQEALEEEERKETSSVQLTQTGRTDKRAAGDSAHNMQESLAKKGV
jgi:hypothetical protein